MKSNIKDGLLFGGLLALVALSAPADAEPKNLHEIKIKNEVVNKVIEKASQTEKGVIMVVSDRGEVAKEAAYLLSEQIQYNAGYLPLLMVPNANERNNAYALQLGLAKQDLPAIIFYNKAGNEIGRVLAAKAKQVL